MDESGSSVEGIPGEEDEASERLEARLLRWDAAIRRSAAQVERAEAARQRAEAAAQRAEAARQHAEAVRSKADHLLDDIGGLHGSNADDRDGIPSDREAVADERERIANEREAEADQRERIANEREVQADERERRANEQESEAEDREDRLRGLKGEVSETQGVANQREAHLDERERILRQEEAEFDERGRIAEQQEIAKEMNRSTQELHRRAVKGGSLAPLIERGVSLRAMAADLADRMAEEAEDFAAYLENAATKGDRERRLSIAKTEHEIARIERHNAARLRDLDKGFELVEHLPPLPGTESLPETPPAGDSLRAAD